MGATLVFHMGDGTIARDGAAVRYEDGHWRWAFVAYNENWHNGGFRSHKYEWVDISDALELAIDCLPDFAPSPNENERVIHI